MSAAPGVVLVTGGAGFIGAHIARALADRGYETRILDTRRPGPQERFLLGPHADALVASMASVGVEDADAVTAAVAALRPQAIVHAGAIGNPLPLARDPRLALEVNAGGTVNVLEAARRHGVEHVVMISSIGVLPSRRYEPIDASHPLLLAGEGAGAGFYGASKIAAEAFCLSYHEAFGIDVRIVRPSAVYGFAMRFPLAVKPLLEGALRGERVTLSSGGALARDHTHVHDVVSLSLALLDAPAAADRIFYGATGEPLRSGLDVAELVRELVPGAELDVAAELGPGEALQSRFRGVLSIENARRQLGWEPRYRDLRDGLSEYADRYREFLAATPARA